MKPYIILCFLFGLVVNPVTAKDTSGGCDDTKHIHKETKTCIYDIYYPMLLNKKVECIVREWIDKEEKEFDDDEPELDPEMHQKNAFWVTCKNYESSKNKTESVVVENYQYAQGAHGETEISTFTFDVESGRLYDLFDVVNIKKHWFGMLQPLISKWADENNSDVIIGSDSSASEKLKYFVIDNENLVLYFGQCEVAACGFGIIKVPISFKKIKSLLNPPFAN